MSRGGDCHDNGGDGELVADGEERERESTPIPLHTPGGPQTALAISPATLLGVGKAYQGTAATVISVVDSPSTAPLGAGSWSVTHAG